VVRQIPAPAGSRSPAIRPEVSQKMEKAKKICSVIIPHLRSRKYSTRLFLLVEVELV